MNNSGEIKLLLEEKLEIDPHQLARVFLFDGFDTWEDYVRYGDAGWRIELDDE